jgi:hypothetical protein
MPREDRLVHPADTSRSNLGTALGLLSRWRLNPNLDHFFCSFGWLAHTRSVGRHVRAQREREPAKHAAAASTTDVNWSAVQGHVRSVISWEREHRQPVVRSRGQPVVSGPGRYDVKLAAVLPNPPSVRHLRGLTFSSVWIVHAPCCALHNSPHP